jgi:hypothetical protein
VILVAKTYWGVMPFWFRKPPEAAQPTSLALRTDDFRVIRALWWTRIGAEAPRVGVVLMHPRVDFTHHYAVPRLVEAGFGVLAANSRHVGNDTMCEHEELVLDLAACVNWLRRKAGVQHVVLLGNSGGGSLAGYYQAQASRAPRDRLSRSPGGAPTRFDVAEMTPADAVVLVAAHRGQGHVLLRSIDAAVVDEGDPFGSDPSLDLYDERNGFREPPSPSTFDPAFVARVRAAQNDRVRRIDERARAMLADHRLAVEESERSTFSQRPFAERQETLRRRAYEPVMVVDRTMANPAYVDPSVDADPQGATREYGSLLSDRPDLMNMSAVGFARTCTPRAWLSTWSGLSSHADLVANAARIDVPTLAVYAARDREVHFVRDVGPVFDACAASDKTLVRIEGARHYFEPEPGEKDAPDVERLMDVVVPWMKERCAVARPVSTAVTASGESAVRHASTSRWTFPRGDRATELPGGVSRTNLRELAARPERFEHHLVPVARVGDVQLEIATASEPLYFAHVNVSDEYAIALPTGDETVDRFPLRTFVTDAASGQDVARYNHRVGDLVLHPLGWMHWPGRLRAPYEPFVFPAGARRCGLTLVLCACAPTPAGERPLRVSRGREADAKSYAATPPPLLLLDAQGEEAGTVARVGTASLELLVHPGVVRAPRGAYLVVLEAGRGSPPGCEPCDLVHLPRGASFDASGIERALLFASDTVDAGPPPASWRRLPEPAFVPFERASRGALPFASDGLEATLADAAHVDLRIAGATARVPRYWLARMLFRVGLHGQALGYVETYGGFFHDDRDGDRGVKLGIRGGEALTLPRGRALALVEALYRAVAPDGYIERLDD